MSVKIEDALSGTEFTYLVDKFKSAGDNNLNKMMGYYQQKKLVEYLRKFEPDETKLVRLNQIIEQVLKKSLKPFYILLLVLAGILIVVSLVAIYFAVVK